MRGRDGEGVEEGGEDVLSFDAHAIPGERDAETGVVRVNYDARVCCQHRRSVRRSWY